MLILTGHYKACTNFQTLTLLQATVDIRMKMKKIKWLSHRKVSWKNKNMPAEYKKREQKTQQQMKVGVPPLEQHCLSWLPELLFHIWCTPWHLQQKHINQTWLQSTFKERETPYFFLIYCSVESSKIRHESTMSRPQK